jgi:hypothetical protein
LIVIVPTKPVLTAGQQRSGWWQIDPVTGRTTDLMDDGRAKVDYGVVLKAVSQIAANPLVRLGACVGAVFKFASGFLYFMQTIAAASEGEETAAFEGLGNLLGAAGEYAVTATICAA